METGSLAYQDKFVAFVDILGFKELVNNSATTGDADSVARIISRLGSERDIQLYLQDGAEICPASTNLERDLGFRISQVSDCVVVSAEVSPAGAINIVNYCRKVAERLLLREHLLCQGYLTRGQIYHEGMTFFGPGYQRAVEGEKRAAAVQWKGDEVGTPFIELDNSVAAYFDDVEDECTAMMFRQMTISFADFTVISPYGLFDRLIEWAIDPSQKTADEMYSEIENARKLVATIETALAASQPINDRGKLKLQVSAEKLKDVREKLRQADADIELLISPFPSPR